VVACGDTQTAEKVIGEAKSESVRVERCREDSIESDQRSAEQQRNVEPVERSQEGNKLELLFVFILLVIWVRLLKKLGPRSGVDVSSPFRSHDSLVNELAVVDGDVGRQVVRDEVVGVVSEELDPVRVFVVNQLLSLPVDDSHQVLSEGVLPEMENEPGQHPKLEDSPDSREVEETSEEKSTKSVD